MSDRATKGERTRRQVIQAAQRLFVERGYHGTSMRQIAQEAGLALGGISPNSLRTSFPRCSGLPNGSRR
jgi:AcrR family transcriptional regulator